MSLVPTNQGLTEVVRFFFLVHSTNYDSYESWYLRLLKKSFYRIAKLRPILSIKTIKLATVGCAQTAYGPLPWTLNWLS